MTQKHHVLIDTVLLQVHQRSEALQWALRQVGGTHHSHHQQQEGESREALLEQLRGSVLGQRLQRAEYVEGYPAAVQPTHRRIEHGLQVREQVEGGMRREVYLVCQVVYGTSFEQQRWCYPKQCHRTELGQLLHAALWQLYHEHLPAEQLVRVMAATKKLGMSRQTVHAWMADGTLRWISDAQRDTIWLDIDEVYRARRLRRHGMEDDAEEE